MSGRPLAAKMKSLLSACCFFSVLALSTAGKLEDCDGLSKTFQFHLLFLYCLIWGLGLTCLILIQISVIRKGAYWVDVLSICGHIFRE